MSLEKSINIKKTIDNENYIKTQLFFDEISLMWFTMRILKNSGYEVENEKQRYVDIIAKNSSQTYYIEIKSSTSLQYRNLSHIGKSISRVMYVAAEARAKPVLLVYSLIPEEKKIEYSMQYPELIIIDLANILSSLEGTKEQSELIAILPFSVDQVELKPIEGEFYLGWMMHSDINASILQELDNCDTGRSGAHEFEEKCTELLKTIFADDLALWSQQQESNNRIYRFDLLCRIKDNNLKTFWGIMEEYFKSKYIVFEFKNYADKITQKEIYTTEKYLYRNALRNVAIIISRNGFDENSKWAAKGCLRENGKLILLITIDELKEMYSRKVDESDPSEVLLAKLDMMLASLEK